MLKTFSVIVISFIVSLFTFSYFNTVSAIDCDAAFTEIPPGVTNCVPGHIINPAGGYVGAQYLSGQYAGNCTGTNNIAVNGVRKSETCKMQYYTCDQGSAYLLLDTVINSCETVSTYCASAPPASWGDISGCTMPPPAEPNCFGDCFCTCGSLVPGGPAVVQCGSTGVCKSEPDPDCTAPPPDCGPEPCNPKIQVCPTSPPTCSPSCNTPDKGGCNTCTSSGVCIDDDFNCTGGQVCSSGICIDPLPTPSGVRPTSPPVNNCPFPNYCATSCSAGDTAVGGAYCAPPTSTCCSPGIPQPTYTPVPTLPPGVTPTQVPTLPPPTASPVPSPTPLPTVNPISCVGYYGGECTSEAACSPIPPEKKYYGTDCGYPQVCCVKSSGGWPSAYTMGGMVYYDKDADGIKDTDETGFGGVTLVISGGGRSAEYYMTDSSGSFAFAGEQGQSYSIGIFRLQEGYEPTITYNGPLSFPNLNADNTNVRIGVMRLLREFKQLEVTENVTAGGVQSDFYGISGMKPDDNTYSNSANVGSNYYNPLTINQSIQANNNTSLTRIALMGISLVSKSSPPAGNTLNALKQSANSGNGFVLIYALADHNDSDGPPPGNGANQSGCLIYNFCRQTYYYYFNNTWARAGLNSGTAFGNTSSGIRITDRNYTRILATLTSTISFTVNFYSTIGNREWEPYSFMESNANGGRLIHIKKQQACRDSNRSKCTLTLNIPGEKSMSTLLASYFSKLRAIFKF